MGNFKKLRLKILIFEEPNSGNNILLVFKKLKTLLQSYGSFYHCLVYDNFLLCIRVNKGVCQGGGGYPPMNNVENIGVE